MVQLHKDENGFALMELVPGRNYAVMDTSNNVWVGFTLKYDDPKQTIKSGWTETQVIQSLISRLHSLDVISPCRENKNAIHMLEEAIKQIEKKKEHE